VKTAMRQRTPWHATGDRQSPRSQFLRKKNQSSDRFESQIDVAHYLKKCPRSLSAG
jgi:hypothetical protein